jgi:hypothetical protein
VHFGDDDQALILDDAPALDEAAPRAANATVCVIEPPCGRDRSLL